MCEIHSQIIHRVAGELSCEYEAEVPSWSRVDFGVSFTVRVFDYLKHFCILLLDS
jgi:hypothetical protein